MSDSPPVAHVKRSIYRVIVRHLDINGILRQRQHLLAEKLGLQGLLDRLAACGCFVVLEDPRRGNLAPVYWDVAIRPRA
jgi:hypothetical protein